MTIITLALNSDRRLALVADRVYSPFSNPQFMHKAKIFRRGSVIVGVSGDICAVDLDQLLNGELPVECTSKAHIIYVDEDTQRVMIAKPCGEDSVSTWFDPLLTGEPVTIGCFAHIVNTGVYGSIPTVELATSRINHLHSAFGFTEPADVIESNIDYDKIIFDGIVSDYFDGQPVSQLKLRQGASVGMPFANYTRSEALQSGCLSTLLAADLENVAERFAKLHNAMKGRVQP